MLEHALKRFAADEAGATAIEYGLIAALIALTILTAMAALAGGTSNLFNHIANEAIPALTPKL